MKTVWKDALKYVLSIIIVAAAFGLFWVCIPNPYKSGASAPPVEGQLRFIDEAPEGENFEMYNGEKWVLMGPEIDATKSEPNAWLDTIDWPEPPSTLTFGLDNGGSVEIHFGSDKLIVTGQEHFGEGAQVFFDEVLKSIADDYIKKYCNPE